MLSKALLEVNFLTMYANSGPDADVAIVTRAVEYGRRKTVLDRNDTNF